ncbi:MAG: hypothetical protein OER04_05295 [Cyclobacteriaceae bacterium]|nr:hypothetical protein [Cyclobacteriaceae bacterium]
MSNLTPLTMKNVFTGLFLVIITATTSYAQDPVSPELLSELSRIEKILNNLQFAGSLGSPAWDLNPSEFNLESNSGSFSLGHLGISYKLNGNITIGISALGTLGNCNSGYLDQEGNFVSFFADDDEDEDEDGDDMEEEDQDIECDDDLIDNIAGTVTVKFSEALPLFVQVTGGYSMAAEAPAISAMIGYNQKLFSELGAYLGIRYSNVFHKIPDGIVDVTSSSGIKAEVGLTWNF